MQVSLARPRRNLRRGGVERKLCARAEGENFEKLREYWIACAALAGRNNPIAGSEKKSRGAAVESILR